MQRSHMGGDAVIGCRLRPRVPCSLALAIHAATAILTIGFEARPSIGAPSTALHLRALAAAARDAVTRSSGACCSAGAAARASCPRRAIRRQAQQTLHIVQPVGEA